jgi:hypothetical protein
MVSLQLIAESLISDELLFEEEVQRVTKSPELNKELNKIFRELA